MTQIKNIDKTKRQFLHHFSVLLGSATAAQLLDGSALSSAFAYTMRKNSEGSDGVLFKKEVMQMLKCICDLVMPKTETLSASELDVHGFIDHQLNAVYSKHDQIRVSQLLKKITHYSQTHFNDEFIQITHEHQVDILSRVEAQAKGFNEHDRSTFKLLKNLIVFGYFTTEYGATEVLKYQAIPGGFKGSIEYQLVGRSWGSLGFY